MSGTLLATCSGMFSFEHDPHQSDDDHEGCDCPECLPEGCMDEAPPPRVAPWFLRPAAQFAAARQF